MCLGQLATPEALSQHFPQPGLGEAAWCLLGWWEGMDSWEAGDVLCGKEAELSVLTPQQETLLPPNGAEALLGLRLRCPQVAEELNAG